MGWSWVRLMAIELPDYFYHVRWIVIWLESIVRSFKHAWFHYCQGSRVCWFGGHRAKETHVSRLITSSPLPRHFNRSQPTIGTSSNSFLMLMLVMWPFDVCPGLPDGWPPPQPLWLLLNHINRGWWRCDNPVATLTKRYPRSDSDPPSQYNFVQLGYPH